MELVFLLIPVPSLLAPDAAAPIKLARNIAIDLHGPRPGKRRVATLRFIQNIHLIAPIENQGIIAVDDIGEFVASPLKKMAIDYPGNFLVASLLDVLLNNDGDSTIIIKRHPPRGRWGCRVLLFVAG